MTYNAGTRVLFLHPDVQVLDDSDVSDPSKLVYELSAKNGFVFPMPFQHNVRQVYLHTSADACYVPHNTPELLRPLLS